MGLWDWQSAFMEGKGIANEGDPFIHFLSYLLMKEGREGLMKGNER